MFLFPRGSKPRRWPLLGNTMIAHATGETASELEAGQQLDLARRPHGDFTIVLQNGAQIAMSRGYRAGLESWLGQPI